MSKKQYKPGRELDALVAQKIFGWQWFKVGSIAVLVFPEMAEEWVQHPVLYTPLASPQGLEREHIDGVYFFDSSRGGKTKPEFPFFSTKDVSAAMQIPERLSDRFSFGCWRAHQESEPSWTWRVKFQPSIVPPTCHEPNDGNYYFAEAKTLNHAVCLAALEAAESAHNVRAVETAKG